MLLPDPCNLSPATSSDDGPAAPREADAGPLLEPLADLLDLTVECWLVRERLLVALDHDAPVHDHGVDAPAVGVVDQVVDRVDERVPLWPLKIEQDQIGLLARLD